MTVLDEIKEMVDDLKKEECQGCGYPTVLKEYESYGPKRIKKKLCIFCANTQVGNAIENPQNYDNLDAMQAICAVGNILLDEIRRRN